MVNRSDTSFSGFVRVGRTGRVRQVTLQEAGLVRGERLVVRSDRGTELATLLQNPVTAGESPAEVNEQELWRLRSDQFWRHFEAGSVVRPAVVESSQDGAEGEVRFIRRASDSDLLRVERELPREEEEALLFFRSKIAELRLPMRPVEVEMTLGGERIMFYFAAEHRVDFRELVRVLARKFQTRVELRRINPREVAALQGSLGICGREVCCKAWLRKLAPVSIKMARAQNRPISADSNLGSCGRLRCCLRYELGNYGCCDDRRSGHASD